APWGLALEDAVAIREAAVGRGDLGHLARRRVERAHRDHGVADFLAVGAHVLDGRAADEPGDPAQALEPRPAALHGGGHETIPRLAGGGGDLDGTAALAMRDAAQDDAD